jgi:hypothetical protein
MKYRDIEELLSKYNWKIDSYSQLEISSENGEHQAKNYAAEVTIEYLYTLDNSGDEYEIQETIDKFKS